MSKPIALAADHGGFELKEAVRAHLDEIGVAYKDFGSFDGASCDYPDMAEPACRAVVAGECDKALLFCGTGVGISMSANKIHGIRACCCSDAFSAEYTRRHNDANALCMGGRVVGAGLAIYLVDLFLNTPFEGGRHQRRIDKITGLEQRGGQYSAAKRGGTPRVLTIDKQPHRVRSGQYEQSTHDFGSSPGTAQDQPSA